MNFRIYSHSGLTTFERCERQALFSRVLKWKPEGGRPNADLAFGNAWHKAMDVVWPGLNAGKPHSEVYEGAFTAFCDSWEADGLPPFGTDINWYAEYKAKTPGVAGELLNEYIGKREGFIAECELLAVEEPFAVQLDPDDPGLFYGGFLDKVVKRDGRVLVIEHKTTGAYSKDFTFKSSFTDSFSPNHQIEGYLLATQQKWPSCDTIYVDGALAHANKKDGVIPGFCFEPVAPGPDMLDQWLWETLERVRRYEANKEVLYSIEAKLPYLPAFVRNTEACYSFGRRCPYLDLCKGFANPLLGAGPEGEPPLGYELDTSSPFHELTPEQLGLTNGQS